MSAKIRVGTLFHGSFTDMRTQQKFTRLSYPSSRNIVGLIHYVTIITEPARFDATI